MGMLAVIQNGIQANIQISMIAIQDFLAEGQYIDLNLMLSGALSAIGMMVDFTDFYDRFSSIYREHKAMTRDFKSEDQEPEDQDVEIEELKEKIEWMDGKVGFTKVRLVIYMAAYLGLGMYAISKVIALFFCESNFLNGFGCASTFSIKGRLSEVHAFGNNTNHSNQTGLVTFAAGI